MEPHPHGRGEALEARHRPQQLWDTAGTGALRPAGGKQRGSEGPVLLCPQSSRPPQGSCEGPGAVLGRLPLPSRKLGAFPAVLQRDWPVWTGAQGRTVTSC